MHYYNRNLGDYAKKAGRLSMLQHGAYTLLIDSCYDREQFPTLEEAIDWTWASSKEEKEAVEFVLRKFFDLEDGRYVQKRIQEEIEAFRAKCEANARIAHERETKRAENRTKRATDVHALPPPDDDSPKKENESPPNQEPITNNQEPITKKAIEPAEVASTVVAREEPPPALASRPVEISKTFRQHGVRTQPADPRIIALAEQGVGLETIAAACEEAKNAKPGEVIALGYVVAILKRWGTDAEALKAGPAPEAPTPKSAQPPPDRWWLSDEGIKRKGQELRMMPRGTESWSDFKDRIFAKLKQGDA